MISSISNKTPHAFLIFACYAFWDISDIILGKRIRLTLVIAAKIPKELGYSVEFLWPGLGISDLKISKIKVETGSAQDIFQYQFNDSYGLLGTVNKADGSIRDVMVIAGGKGLANPKTAANATLSWGVLIQTTNPDLPPTERGNVMRDVGALGDNVNYKDVDKSTVRGNIKYHLQGSEVLGIMFSAGDVNDNK